MIKNTAFLYDKSRNAFYNEDCVLGSKKYIDSNSIDLIITDPPYGIEGDTLHKHYNRNEGFVVDGYIEVPKREYADFSVRWIREAERILRPGGSMYVVSGYTNLSDILNALKETSLKEVNHIIWKFNFGVYTTRKYVSSHYHILFYEKPGGKRTFNTFVRYGQTEKLNHGGSANYEDREDVWVINREYKPGVVKNKNELPTELLIKMVQYSSNEGDTVCDLFLGGFSTAKVAIGLNRYTVGFELNSKMFEHKAKEISNIEPGHLIPSLKKPSGKALTNYGKPWNIQEIARCRNRYREIYQKIRNKKKSIELLSDEFERGYFAILNILEHPYPTEKISERKTISFL